MAPTACVDAVEKRKSLSPPGNRTLSFTHIAKLWVMYKIFPVIKQPIILRPRKEIQWMVDMVKLNAFHSVPTAAFSSSCQPQQSSGR